MVLNSNQSSYSRVVIAPALETLVACLCGRDVKVLVPKSGLSLAIEQFTCCPGPSKIYVTFGMFGNASVILFKGFKGLRYLFAGYSAGSVVYEFPLFVLFCIS